MKTEKQKQALAEEVLKTIRKSSSNSELNELLSALVRLRKKLRSKATKEAKKIGNDATHFEGMNKGLWIAYSESANEIDKIVGR